MADAAPFDAFFKLFELSRGGGDAEFDLTPPLFGVTGRVVSELWASMPIS